MGRSSSVARSVIVVGIGGGGGKTIFYHVPLPISHPLLNPNDSSQTLLSESSQGLI